MTHTDTLSGLTCVNCAAKVKSELVVMGFSSAGVIQSVLNKKQIHCA